MGDGYDFVCKKCKKEYSVMHGIGMMYPTIYQETIEDAKNGKYGSEWQELISSSKYIAINAEREVYICSSCGQGQVGAMASCGTDIKMKMLFVLSSLV